MSDGWLDWLVGTTRWMVCGVSAVSLAGAVGCSGDASTGTPTGPSQTNPLDDQETALVAALNAHRKAAGSGDVSACAILNVSASKHSDDMRDNDYLDDDGRDGSTPRSRACAEGYAPACEPSSAMAELVASGVATADATLGQWTKEAGTNAILVDANLSVAGVGRAPGDVAFWTLDLASTPDPSCELP